MRKNIVIANWKMNTLLEEGMILFEESLRLLKEAKLMDTEVVFCVPYTHLFALGGSLNETHDDLEVYLGAQDCSANTHGAFTGEVSAAQVADAGASFVIIGHSERRKYHNEQSPILINKIDECFANLLNVIYCVGETSEQRQAGKHKETVKKQLEEVAFIYNDNEIQNFIIAYEPVWAIGSQTPATPDDAEEMHAFIRTLLINRYGNEIAERIQIIYGGSCTSNNAATIMAMPNVDGGLIGGASLLAEEFFAIIQTAALVP